MKPTQISTALFLFGILATIATSVVLFAVDSDRRKNDFQRAADSVQTDIQATIGIQVELIEQSAAAVSILPEISRDQFASFVSATEREHTHPAMRAISWIPIIQNESRLEFESNAVGEGFENFQITQRKSDGQLSRSEVRDRYYPVFYIEPLEGNEPAVGFDLGSNQHRLTALSMSTVTESTVATSPIELVQRQGSAAGFLIFSPVYIRSSGDLSGFISGVFDIDVLVETSMLSNQSHGVDFSLVDEEHDLSIPILSGSVHDSDYIASDPVLRADSNYVSEITLPNRTWTLRVGQSPGAFERSGLLWAVPLLGIISSIGIATSAQMIERRRQTSLLLIKSEFERAKFDRRIVEQELKIQAHKTQMIDSVSHELRTPLTVITARADLLRRKLPDVTEKQKVDLDSIQRSAKQLKEMIDSIIEYSTGDFSLSTARPEIFEVNDIVRQVAAHFGSNDLRSRLVINISDTLLTVRCDAVLVRRALIELIENAATYGDAEEAIRVSVRGEGTFVDFSVESSGELIPVAQGQALFQPLTRGALIGDASQPGIGLGLAFVRSIAEVHNGEIIFRHSSGGKNVFGFQIAETGRKDSIEIA